MAEKNDVAETKKMTEIEVAIDQELYEQAKAALAPYHISMEDYLMKCIKLTVDKKEWVLDEFKKGVAVEDILGVISWEAVLDLVRRDGQLEILLTGYREGIFTTEAIVSVAKKAGCLDDMISRIEKDETPETMQKFFKEWDPDFAKVTPAERERMDAAEAETETVSHEDIDWE